METQNYICKNCGLPAVDWKGNSTKTCPKCELKPTKKYYVELHIEKIIEAEDKDDAIDKFYIELEDGRNQTLISQLVEMTIAVLIK